MNKACIKLSLYNRVPAVALPTDQINVLEVTVLFSKDLLSFLVNFSKINFFYFILSKGKGFRAIWCSKQQNFPFQGLTEASVGEFSWVSWLIEANFSKMNTFLLNSSNSSNSTLSYI